MVASCFCSVRRDNIRITKCDVLQNNPFKLSTFRTKKTVKFTEQSDVRHRLWVFEVRKDTSRNAHVSLWKSFRTFKINDIIGLKHHLQLQSSVIVLKHCSSSSTDCNPHGHYFRLKIKTETLQIHLAFFPNNKLNFSETYPEPQITAE